MHGKHKDRLIIIDPSDFLGPPAFNIFKPPNERRYLAYDPYTREALDAQRIDLLSYIFSSRKQTLTAKQGPCFEQVCRLMLNLPNPSLPLLFNILKDQQGERKQSFHNTRPEWKEAISKLDPMSAQFFHDDYFNNYISTRDEIVSRLWGVVSRPAIGRVFGAQQNNFDMFDALQTGQLVVVNVPLGLLQESGAELFGKFMIAYTFSAILERITIPKSQWRPAFLYIDEFQLFADDEKTPSLLGLIREYKCGVTIYTQLLEYFSELIRSVVLTNTRIRYAARVTTDANAMARAMGNCDPAFFTKAVPDDIKGVVKLACYVDGASKEPAIVELPAGAIEREPRMTEAQQALLLERNRRSVSTKVVPQQPQPAPPPPSSHATRPPGPPHRPAPAQTAPPPPKPPPPQAPPQTDRLRDRTGALDWEVTVNPRIAEAGGEIPLVVQRGGQPVKINVKIPPLTKNNTVLRLAGLGTFRPDKTRGDLYLTIRVPAYPEQNTDWADKW